MLETVWDIGCCQLVLLLGEVLPSPLGTFETNVVLGQHPLFLRIAGFALATPILKAVSQRKLPYILKQSLFSHTLCT
jgi:hypothetical protein